MIVCLVNTLCFHTRSVILHFSCVCIVIGLAHGSSTWHNTPLFRPQFLATRVLMKVESLQVFDLGKISEIYGKFNLLLSRRSDQRSVLAKIICTRRDLIMSFACTLLALWFYQTCFVGLLVDCAVLEERQPLPIPLTSFPNSSYQAST